MSQLVGVHGIGLKYFGRSQILVKWAPALADGLQLALGRPPAVPLDFNLAFYGHLFRSAEDATLKGPAHEQDGAALANLDAGELSELTAAVKEIVTPDDLADADAEAGLRKAVLWLPVPVQCLVGAIERRFPRASGIAVLNLLYQVRRYLLDPQLKAEIDQITAVAATGCTVLIGHSLGSVVAYEFLRQHPREPVKLLLTVGSPLGLRSVRDRLPPGKPGAAKWVNVRDPNDPVTAAGPLGHWFPGVPDWHAENGLDAHAAARYLGSKAVGKAVLDVLPELGQ
jgi:hypothetical protein